MNTLGTSTNHETRPLLTVSDLRVQFDTFGGTLKAVDGVDLLVNEGETLGLVGESGCGKTVTALSILRLLPSPPARLQGRIIFDDSDLLLLGKDKIRLVRGNSISMIFQEPMTSLNPVMNAGRQIAEAIILHQGLSHREAWEKAVDMLHLVQIPSPRQRAKEYPHRMSGGMRQRVGIAMALACNPRLLLADEPTTALDVTIQAQIVDLILQLKERFKMSMVLISHDLGLIAEMASRVAVMYAGQIVEEATVREMSRDPLHPYTKGLVGSVPVLGRKFSSGQSRLKVIPGMVPSLHEIPTGCRFHPRCSQAQPLCYEKAPDLLESREGRKVRCWFWQ